MENRIPSSMNTYAAEGTKVRGIFKNGVLFNGTDSDRERAMRYIREDVIYSVDKTNVHQSSTSVYLKEFPGIPFNSVHFTEVIDRMENLFYSPSEKIFFHIAGYTDNSCNVNCIIKMLSDYQHMLSKLIDCDPNRVCTRFIEKSSKYKSMRLFYITDMNDSEVKKFPEVFVIGKDWTMMQWVEY